MPSFRRFVGGFRVSWVYWIAVLAAMAMGVLHAAAARPGSAVQEAVSSQDGPYAQPPAPIVRQPAEPQPGPAARPQAQDLWFQAAGANFDPALFQRPIPKDQLAFLSQFVGMPSNALYREKQFRNLMHSFVPDCTFHFGVDLSLTDALDQVVEGSSEPVQIREGRYVLVSGHMATHHMGRGFLWIDMQTGIGLGGFFFRPGNGEPTPAVNVFSRQVQKEMLLDWSELPAAFAQDVATWEQEDGVPPLTTRYFITGSNKKVLLEHDEDFCMASSGAGYNDCQQMNEDAADIDMTAASYLEQTHHVTNATAWMITDPDQVVWIGMRDRTCGGVLDPAGCHIRMTRERTHVILHAPAPRPRPIRR